MPRRRSTRAELIQRKEKQAQVIAELMLSGAEDVAAQVTRCWHDRLFSDPQEHRYRCRSCACLTCRRPSLASWWRAFRRWSYEGGATSYFRLSGDDLLAELPRLAKSLRNRRDRLAREQSWLFADVSFVGLSDGRCVHLIVSHPGLRREQVGDCLKTLWPTLVLEDVPAAPVFELSPLTLAKLGARQRGLQPLRFSISSRAY